MTRDHLLGWTHAAQFIADSMPAPVKPCPVRLVPVTERVGVADVDPAKGGVPAQKPAAAPAAAPEAATAAPPALVDGQVYKVRPPDPVPGTWEGSWYSRWQNGRWYYASTIAVLAQEAHKESGHQNLRVVA